MSPTFPQNVEIRNVLREASVARHIQSWRLRSFWRQLKSRDVNCEGMDRQSCREESKRRRPPAPSRVRARHRPPASFLRLADNSPIPNQVQLYRPSYSTTDISGEEHVRLRDPVSRLPLAEMYGHAI